MKKHRQRSYRKPILRLSSVLATGVCLMIAGCAPDSGDERGGTSSSIDGAAVFAENCAVCHLGGRAPRLESIKALPQAERTSRIRNHPRAGNLADRLTAATLLDLIDFLNSVPADAVEPEGPGADTFARECGGCHVDGRGPSFVELGKLNEEQFLARMRTHPVAGAIPQRLTAAQLGALIEFFEGD